MTPAQALALYHTAKQRAESINIDFYLTADWFESSPELCCILNTPLKPGEIIIQRLNPSLGFTEENSRLISKRAAQIIEYTLDELLDTAEFIARLSSV